MREKQRHSINVLSSTAFAVLAAEAAAQHHCFSQQQQHNTASKNKRVRARAREKQQHSIAVLSTAFAVFRTSSSTASLFSQQQQQQQHDIAYKLSACEKQQHSTAVLSSTAFSVLSSRSSSTALLFFAAAVPVAEAAAQHRSPVNSSACVRAREKQKHGIAVLSTTAIASPLNSINTLSLPPCRRHETNNSQNSATVGNQQDNSPFPNIREFPATEAAAYIACKI